jgi:CelD/BcsL family acetyltransferase involved in cellulose biosynthesis
VGYREEWIDDPRRLTAIAEAWDETAACLPSSPFSSHAWFSTWWEHFGRGRLAACVLWDGSELMAGFPLSARSRALFALANTETPAFRPVARDTETLRRISETVATAAPVLEVANLPAGEPAHEALAAAVARARRRDVTLLQYGSPLTNTTGTFEGYRAERKDRWRELERRGRKMAREHEVELRAVAPPEAFEAELEAGLRLESSGWKGREGTAILAVPAMAGFYRAVARAAHERGDLRFSALRLDGRLVAFDLALLSEGRYFLLKTAYDESLRKLAPGLVLRRAVIERCFELGLTAHEFLGIDMPWKQLFATETRRHVRYRAYGRGPLPTARYAYRGLLRPAVKRATVKIQARRGRTIARSA